MELGGKVKNISVAVSSIDEDDSLDVDFSHHSSSTSNSYCCCFLQLLKMTVRIVTFPIMPQQQVKASSTDGDDNLDADYIPITATQHVKASVAVVLPLTKMKVWMSTFLITPH